MIACLNLAIALHYVAKLNTVSFFFVRLLIAISSVTPNREQNVFLANHQTVSLADVERGLEFAIRRGYTTTNDPVVFKVREFLALVRNGTTVARAVERTNLSMSVVVSLAKLGMGDIHQLNQLILN